jgi:hypothetical protein
MYFEDNIQFINSIFCRIIRIRENLNGSGSRKPKIGRSGSGTLPLRGLKFSVAPMNYINNLHFDVVHPKTAKNMLIKVVLKITLGVRKQPGIICRILSNIPTLHSDQ